jgi:hypothetical protein
MLQSFPEAPKRRQVSVWLTDEDLDFLRTSLLVSGSSPCLRY